MAYKFEVEAEALIAFGLNGEPMSLVLQPHEDGDVMSQLENVATAIFAYMMNEPGAMKRALEMFERACEEMEADQLDIV